MILFRMATFKRIMQVNNKLRNYACHTETYNFCLLHAWSSVVHINNHKNFDINKHQHIANGARTPELIHNR